MFHFVSGYTAKVAGTEVGVEEPKQPFPPALARLLCWRLRRVYAELLHKRLKEHGAEIWLVNTGWQGGKYGVGKRMAIPYTRSMVTAAVEGMLKN